MTFLRFLRHASVVTSLTYRVLATSMLIVHLVKSTRKKDNRS